MSIWNLFGKSPDGPSLEKGLEEWKNTPGAALLDVRTREEYAGGHVPGSVNLPLDEVEGIREDPGTPLFVYCRSGARSQRACDWLAGHGYRAVNIGGVMGYQGPLETGEE